MSGGVKTGGGKLGNFERREGQGAKGLTTYVDGAPLAPSVQPLFRPARCRVQFFSRNAFGK